MKKLNLLIMAAFASSAVNVMAADSEVKPKSATEQRATIEKAMTPETRTGTMPSTNIPKPKSETDVRTESMPPAMGTADRKAKSAGNTDAGVVKPKSETDERRDMSTGNTGGANMGRSNMGGSNVGGSSMSGSSQSGMSMTGGIMGSHALNGKITKINHKTGKVTVRTDEGNMDVNFPAGDVQDLKKGDTISVHMGYTRG